MTDFSATFRGGAGDAAVFLERTLCSVTANTRKDGEDFHALAERQRRCRLMR